MRAVALLFGILFATKVAAAENLYATVAAYLDEATKGNLSEYFCAVSSDYPSLRGCWVSERKDGISRVFGVVISHKENRGLIFVLDHGPNGYSVAEKSEMFKNGDFWAVDEFGADTNDRFHIQFHSGSMSMPTYDLYRFASTKGEWRVTGLDHGTPARCTDGSIGEGDSYSANFLTGTVVLKRTTDCKNSRLSRRKMSFPPFPLSRFSPIDIQVELP